MTCSSAQCVVRKLEVRDPSYFGFALSTIIGHMYHLHIISYRFLAVEVDCVSVPERSFAKHTYSSS